MKKFYEKSEMGFAIAAILLYVIPTANLRARLDFESPVVTLWLLALTALFAGFLVKNRLCEKYGLTRWPSGHGYLYFVPFLLIGLMNLRGGVKLNYQNRQVFAVISMALVGFLEEIIFRGFLFKAIARESLRRAIAISALTFGIGHLVNLLTGQGGLDTVLQMVYAVALGFAFVIVFHYSGSLWPCIVTHSLIDVTSTFANEATLSPMNINVFGPLFILIVSIAYAMYVMRRNGQNTAGRAG